MIMFCALNVAERNLSKNRSCLRIGYRIDLDPGLYGVGTVVIYSSGQRQVEVIVGARTCRDNQASLCWGYHR